MDDEEDSKLMVKICKPLPHTGKNPFVMEVEKM